jgi:hypothetical protein
MVFFRTKNAHLGIFRRPFEWKMLACFVTRVTRLRNFRNCPMVYFLPFRKVLVTWLYFMFHIGILYLEKFGIHDFNRTNVERLRVTTKYRE